MKRFLGAVIEEFGWALFWSGIAFPVAYVVSLFAPSGAAILILAAGSLGLLSILIPVKFMGIKYRAGGIMIFFAALAGAIATADIIAAENAKSAGISVSDYKAQKDELRRERERERAAAVAASALAARKSEDVSQTQPADDQHRGFHCLSKWDGSHSKFKDAVKARLRDPKSFEHIETVVSPETNGFHVIIMTFRAENGFGGMTVEKAIGSFANSDCAFEILSIGA